MSLARSLAAITVALLAVRAHAAAPVIEGCGILPDDNPWNTPIEDAAVSPDSDLIIATINANGGDFVHPDFGANPDYGIPWTTVEAGQSGVPVEFDVPEESEAGPWPIPSDAPVEGGSDRHVLVIETGSCTLHELYATSYGGSDEIGWSAFSGARWPLGSNKLRPDRWTSADAAGLPILPGLARCEEANAGQITHAFRFTVSRTRKAYQYPASHHASSYTGAKYPPMGLRMRLKSSYDTSALDGQAGAIAQALKTYGMILADNGSNWYISGETNPGCWDDEDLDRLKDIPGTAFEVIVAPPPPSDIVGDVLANGGFEAGVPAKTVPGFWTVVGTGVRICNDPEYSRIYTTAGQCAGRLNPGAEGLSRFAQTVFAPPAGKLRLRLRAKPQDLPPGGASASAVVYYTDGTRRRFGFELPGGTSGYVPRSFDFTPNAAKTVDRVRIQLDHVAPSGRILFDQVALLHPAN